MIVSILAFSTCDRSEGNPGKVGPIRFRYDSTGQTRIYIDSGYHDLPNALRALAEALESEAARALIAGIPEIVTSHTHSPEELEKKLDELASRPDIEAD